jgi:hypothetical protein
MPRKKANVPNMFEPPVVQLRRSRRGQAAAVAEQSEAQLLQHIASLRTLADVETLKAQMDTQMIPKTRTVKKALYDQEEMIRRDMEDDVPSEEEMRAKRRAIKAARRGVGSLRSMKHSGMFFGPATRKKSRGRRAMEGNAAAREAAANAELNALLEASHNQQNAVAANAVAEVDAGEAAAQEPFFRVPGYNRAAYHELIGFPGAQARGLLQPIPPNEGRRTFTPEELRRMELEDYARWAANVKRRGGRRQTRRGSKRRSRR